MRHWTLKRSNWIAGNGGSSQLALRDVRGQAADEEGTDLFFNGGWGGGIGGSGGGGGCCVRFESGHLGERHGDERSFERDEKEYCMGEGEGGEER